MFYGFSACFFYSFLGPWRSTSPTLQLICFSPGAATPAIASLLQEETLWEEGTWFFLWLLRYAPFPLNPLFFSGRHNSAPVPTSNWVGVNRIPSSKFHETSEGETWKGVLLDLLHVLVNDHTMKIQNDVAHLEATTTGHGMEVKSSSLHPNHRLAKDEAFSAGYRVRRSLEPKEKDTASKFYQQNVVAQPAGDRFQFSSKSSGYHQNPRPSRMPVGAEELVKHMSNVPGYLQRIERCDNLQEKALTFGVLGWKNLEKWTDNHRREAVNDRAAVFLSSGNDPSACSTSGSSSKYCRNGDSRRVACRNQSSPLNFHQDSSAEDDNAVTRSRVSCSISDSAELHLRMDNLAAKLEQNKREALGSKSVSDYVGHYSRAFILSSRSKDCAALHPISGKLKTLKAVPGYREKFGELSQECCITSLSTLVDHPQEHHRSGRSQPSDDILDPFQENPQGSRRFSFASTGSGYTIQSESGDTSSAEIFPYENFQLPTPNISYSCPLTPDGHNCDSSDVDVTVREHGEGLEGSCHLTNSPLLSGKLETVRSNGWHEKIGNPAIKPHKSFAAETPEKWSWNRTKRVTATGRELLHDNDSCGELSDVIGRSRSRENSARRQPKWSSSSDGHNGERAADSSRGRRSPLRRLIDPLLKPKAFSRARAAKLDADSPTQPSCESQKLPVQEEPSSARGLHSSTPEIAHSCRSNSTKSSTSSSWVPMGNQWSDDNKEHEASKQTLLQLAWKNGLPLFTFSVSESDILAATRKKVATGKEDRDCIYTLYYVCEAKKKPGSWINQGNKSKRKGLVSSAVGQMNVSCIRRRRNHFSVMEFVLLGPELRPSVHGTSEPVPNSELAAIVVEVPETDVESFIGGSPLGNSRGNLLKTNPQEEIPPMGILESERNTEKNAPKMVAILPSEVHGLSEIGKPSPLVDRWRSQGLCDCGGWDVGCPLKILTNNLQDSRPGSVQPSHTTDGTHRVELFTRGLGQESRPVFSLVAFKEGLYTVDFHASIAPLQAFAVCLAVLHGRTSTGLHEPQVLHQPRRVDVEWPAS